MFFVFIFKGLCFLILGSSILVLCSFVRGSVVGGTGKLQPRRIGVRNPGKLRVVVVGRGKGGKQERKGRESGILRRQESVIKR